MTAGNIDATFGPARGDRATLSKASLATLDALYRHPVAHNLEWSDVLALFAKIGSEHHPVRRRHAKDLTADEVMEFRHLLSRAGWSPHAPVGARLDPTAPVRAPRSGEDLLVVVEHHEARLYHLDVRSADPADDTIRPYDPHHFLHHLSHKDQSRERGQRSAEDPSFYEGIARAVLSSDRIVVIGHGKGRSDAAHHLMEHLRLHHPETFRKVTHEVSADLSGLTPPQLLVLGRRALSS